MNRYPRLLTAFLFAGLLAACGGGGGSPGITATGGGGTPVDPNSAATALVADIAIFTDKTSVSNGGTDAVNVTVVAVNANRNAVAGATVTVSTDKNSVFTPTTAGPPITDGTGTYSGVMTIGSDKTIRTITITATSNGITKQTTVQVADIAGPGPTPVAVAAFAFRALEKRTPRAFAEIASGAITSCQASLSCFNWSSFSADTVDLEATQ